MCCDFVLAIYIGRRNNKKNQSGRRHGPVPATANEIVTLPSPTGGPAHQLENLSRVTTDLDWLLACSHRLLNEGKSKSHCDTNGLSNGTKFYKYTYICALVFVHEKTV